MTVCSTEYVEGTMRLSSTESVLWYNEGIQYSGTEYVMSKMPRGCPVLNVSAVL